MNTLNSEKAARTSRGTARLNPRHQAMVREKIRASMLVRRLEQCAEGKIDMSPAQVNAARALLDKCIANAPSELKLSGHLDADITIDRKSVV